jgi:hypothetical protein
MTSQESCVNVTMLPFVYAAGKLFGGIFGFPRKKERENEKLARGFYCISPLFRMDDLGKLFDCP